MNSNQAANMKAAETHVGSVCGGWLPMLSMGGKHRAAARAAETRFCHQRRGLLLPGRAHAGWSGWWWFYIIMLSDCITHTAPGSSFWDAQKLNQVHLTGADVWAGYTPHQCKKVKPSFPSTEAGEQGHSSADCQPKPFFLSLWGSGPSIRYTFHRAALVNQQHWESCFSLPHPHPSEGKVCFYRDWKQD